MKLLKLSLLAMILAIVMMSCSDNSATAPINESNKIPDTKISVTSYIDGEVIDFREVTKTKSTDYLPVGYAVPGSYNDFTNYFNMNINNVLTDESRFILKYAFKFDSLENGVTSISYENENPSGMYEYDSLLTLSYIQIRGTLLINKVQKLDIRGEMQYYITGDMEVVYRRIDDSTKKVTANIEFSGMKVGYSNER